MEAHYTWNTTLFSRKFEIFRQDFPAGTLSKGGWLSGVEGELNGRRIMFRTKGFFRFETKIIDMHNEQEIAYIRFRNLKLESTLVHNGREYKCHFENLLKTRWSIGTRSGALVRYHSQPFKGVITAYTNDEVLILSGFFIRNFLKQRSATIASSS